MIFDELTAEAKLPRIAIIDDRQKEVQSIETELQEKGIPFEFREVDLSEGFQGIPIGSVELVFLDLNYEGSPFEPYLCLEAIKTVVNVGQRYFLVAWTKDPSLLDQVIPILKTEGLMPIGYTSIQKTKYQTGAATYNIDGLFHEIESDFKDLQFEEEYLGQILQSDDSAVLINCIIGEGEFQVRRFDVKPLENYINLDKGAFIRIKIITKPGTRIFEFSNEMEDKSEVFVKRDDFKDIGDISFLMEEDDEDNV